MNAKSQIQTNSILPFTPVQSGILQRKCASCSTHTVAGDKCEDCKNKQGVLQRKSSDNSAHMEVPPIVHEVLNSSGQPLDTNTRSFFETRFAHNFSKVPVSSVSRQLSQSSLTIGEPADIYEQEADRIADSIMLKEKTETLSANKQQGAKFDLSQVRIHTDARAAESARAVNALAYTVGNNIVFGAGQFESETRWGRHLLAHELAHVVQQSGVNQIGVGQGDKKIVPSPVGTNLIQRYEGPEHQDLGDKNLEELFDYIQTEEGGKWAKDRGIDAVKLVREIAQDPVRRNKKIKVRSDLDLTPGEIISLMGDFYATWQDLQDAPKQEIDKILSVMKKERTGGVDANVEYEKITKGRYIELAKVNTKHFAPKNRDAWQDLHIQAIAKAKQGGADKDNSLIEEAYLMDAAGGHFLTDAFASGHLFDSAKVEAAIRRYLENNQIREENPEMQTVTTGLGIANVLPSLVLKNIHDRMNAEGFTVTNAKGMTWKTYGDNHLKNAEETRKIAAYAVFVSRQQITRAKEGESPNVTEVLDLLPSAKNIEQATDQAYGYISQAVREVAPLVHRNIGVLGTKSRWYLGGPILPFVGKSVIGTISDPGRMKTLEDYQQRKDLDRTTPYPMPPLLRFDW